MSTCPPNTPMAVMGDLNIVDSLDPLNNLITGNIVNEATYGADSPPDWDGTVLADAHPVHNGCTARPTTHGATTAAASPPAGSIMCCTPIAWSASRIVSC